MTETSSCDNLFIVDTTYQLLNAIEAANYLGLSNNHLIIVNEAGQLSGAYKKIIDSKDWVKVINVWLAIDTDKCNYVRLGPRVAEFARRWYARYLNLQRMRIAAKIAESIVEVNNLFLGHYWADHKPFMRHFANTIRHRNLYILDDGTDIIDVNNRRRALDNIDVDDSFGHSRVTSLPVGNVARHLLRKYWRWDISEARNVTFFTTYDLHTRPGDHVVKNEYRYLRSLAAAAKPNGEIYFLGQCLVDDGYVDAETYLDYLGRVKAYFGDEAIKYIPHPRESEVMVKSVHDILGFEIKKFDVPVEYQLVVSEEIPKVIASFFCSALESCSNMFADRIKIACFYISPSQMNKAQKAVASIYEYFERKASDQFMYIKL